MDFLSKRLIEYDVNQRKQLWRGLGLGRLVSRLYASPLSKVLQCFPDLVPINLFEVMFLTPPSLPHRTLI